jgi:hypothetical protein
MRQTVSDRIARSIVPAFFFFVGLAGIPDDLEQWARWMRASHLPLAAWVAVAAAVVLAWLASERRDG